MKTGKKVVLTREEQTRVLKLLAKTDDRALNLYRIIKRRPLNWFEEEYILPLCMMEAC